jgi:hypothetical protein
VSEQTERDEGRELRRRKVIAMLIRAGGRSIWDGDDRVGWEDGEPRQTMRGYAVGSQLLVMIESEGGIDVLRSINPKNSLDDLGETIARIGRGEPEPYLITQALRDSLIEAGRQAIAKLWSHEDPEPSPEHLALISAIDELSLLPAAATNRG